LELYHECFSQQQAMTFLTDEAAQSFFGHLDLWVRRVLMVSAGSGVDIARRQEERIAENG
jgi:hypothetical protein